MAIRIRQINGLTVALCAVETDPMPGDVYLDDTAQGAQCMRPSIAAQELLLFADLRAQPLFLFSQLRR